MKKLVYSVLAVAAVLFAVSCNKEQTTTIANGDEVTVTFDVDALAGLQTKAISDGLGATDLTVAVYTADMTEIPALQQTATFSNLKAKVSFSLVKGQTYNFAFWAVNPDCSAYAFNTADAKVTVSYDGVTSNDETRDAFFAVEKNLTVTGPMSKTIVLRRPFAQLNFGSAQADWDAAVAAGITVKQSNLVVATKLPDTISLFDGAVSGEKNVTFALANIPTEKLTVEGVEYVYLQMNYLLAPAEKTLIDATFSVNDASATVNTIDFSNIPIQRNYRTNIVGNLLTSTVDFNIIIDPVYAGEYNEINDYTIPPTSFVFIESADQWNALVTAPNAVIPSNSYILNADVEGANSFKVAEGNQVAIDLNGHTLTLTGGAGSTGTEKMGMQLLKNATVTIKNGKLKVTDSGKAIFWIQNYCNLTLEDVEIDASAATNCQYVLSNNCGTTNIIGSTSIKAPAGAVAFDVCDAAGNGYPTVTVNVNTSGTIDGKVEYGNWGTPGGKAYFNIEAGTFTGALVVYSAVASYAPNNIKITGGSFSDASWDAYK